MKLFYVPGWWGFSVSAQMLTTLQNLLFWWLLYTKKQSICKSFFLRRISKGNTFEMWLLGTCLVDATGQNWVHRPPVNTLHAATEIRCSQIHTYVFLKQMWLLGDPSYCELSDSSVPVVYLDKHILYQEFWSWMWIVTNLRLLGFGVFVVVVLNNLRDPIFKKCK